MDTARTLAWRPRLRLYKRVEVDINPSANLWDRFDYLNRKPTSCILKIGDYCDVVKPDHELHGQEVRVDYASGNLVRVVKGSKSYHFQVQELKWKAHSQAS